MFYLFITCVARASQTWRTSVAQVASSDRAPGFERATPSRNYSPPARPRSVGLDTRAELSGVSPGGARGAWTSQKRKRCANQEPAISMERLREMPPRRAAPLRPRRRHERSSRQPAAPGQPPAHLLCALWGVCACATSRAALELTSAAHRMHRGAAAASNTCEKCVPKRARRALALTLSHNSWSTTIVHQSQSHETVGARLGNATHTHTHIQIEGSTTEVRRRPTSAAASSLPEHPRARGQ